MTRTSRFGARAWDVAGMALSLSLAAIVVVDGLDTGSISHTRAVISAVTAVASTAALWWRRRWPVAIAIALAFPTVLTDAVGGAELVAVFTVASMRSWRVTLWIVALHVAMSLVFVRLWQNGESFVTLGILSLAFLSVPAAWGIVARSRREVIDSLRERAERAESEAQLRAERVRGMERERIAREMHDALAHRISLVSLHAGALEVRPDVGPAEVESIAATIRSSAHGALEDLREILGVLRSGDAAQQVRPQPGLGDVEALIAESTGVGVMVDYAVDVPTDVALSSTASRTVHRVMQEGLTNARKHSPGRAVRCGIAAESDEIRVWLENDLGSAGGIELPGSRSGLIGLTERVDLAGGTMDFGVRRSPAGPLVYRLEARLPWQK